MLAHIGDFVLSLRALRKLRDGFPDSRMTLVVAPWNVDLARAAGFFDEVVAFDFFPRLNKDWFGPNPDIFRRFEALGLPPCEIAIDLRHDADTRPCLYRVDARVRAGFAAPHEEGLPYLDLILPHVENLQLSNGDEYSVHAELRLEWLADAVVSAYGDRTRNHPIPRLAGSATAEYPPRPFAILAVGAGDAIRRWPSPRFAEVAKKLIRERELDILVVGGSAEKEMVEAVVSELPADRARRVVDLPLIDLAALTSRASLLVGLGTGVTHLAATLGIPTVAVLSGVSPLQVWRPAGPRLIGLTGEMPCSPCGFKEASQCPFGVACLSAITPDHVMTAIDRLLGAAPS